jgi:hypothetical protein
MSSVEKMKRDERLKKKKERKEGRRTGSTPSPSISQGTSPIVKSLFDRQVTRLTEANELSKNSKGFG